MKRTFAVAAGHPITAEAAAEALRAGGGAVDAVIAGALTACVVEPVLASLLGGGFLMVRQPDGATRLLDFFVQTPRVKRPEGEVDLRAVEADFGDARQVFHIGAGAIATPGVPRGLFEAHARLGRIPFPELAAPAVAAAKNGAPLAAFQAQVLKIVKPIFTATPEMRALYCEGGALAGADATLRNPALADVLETFAREGDRFCHEGEVAAALLSLDGGHLTAQDLKRHRAIWRDPLVEARGPLHLHLNPPPSLGGALIAFALRLIGRGAPPTEIARAFAATSRARLEVDLNRSPVDGTARLLSDDLCAAYRRDVVGRKASVRGTTHISVIDGEGAGAALTLSNGAGSGLVAPGTGLIPNNMLGEEDLAGPGLDGWAPDERLASMMAPMAATWPDGRVAMLGSGGSNRIRTALAQVLARIAGGARLEDAVTAPRLHVEGGAAPHLDFEDRLRDDARAALLADWPEARGWPEDSMFFGGVHAVARDARGGFEAVGDHRRAGVAIIG